MIQRSLANSASLRVRGRCSLKADRIEARLVPREPGQGAATAWKLLDGAFKGGVFDGAVVGQGGWYNLEIRAMVGQSAVATALLQRVGIGEVFIVVGHSVAAGQDQNMEGATDDRVNTVPLDPKSPAHQAYLKSGDPRHLPEPVFVHYGAGVVPAPFGNGSYLWSRFGELVAREQNIPVLIFNAAFGGTSLEHWARSARSIPFEHSFVKASIRMPYINLANTLSRYIPLTGLRAILADQGQNDWPEKDEQSIYQNYMAWVEQARADLKAPELPIVVNRQTPFLRDAQIRRVQERMIRTRNCFPGPDYDTLPKDARPDDIHLGLAGQAAAARLWAQALDDHFFQSAKPCPAGGR
ncbi:MAG TPA: sialate O-acetylesterase [Tepidisphaeraceae bacterium]|nr:sialate O-acetylesterase [Tepidisphaeraceae bacterium]